MSTRVEEGFHLIRQLLQVRQSSWQDDQERELLIAEWMGRYQEEVVSRVPLHL